jgi:acetyl-CoA C-acetyltransferase
MRDVAVVGVGMNRWGELWKKSYRDIWAEAALEAIGDAGVDHVDALYVGCMSGGLFMGQEHLGAALADQLGMGPIPGTRVESACASGGMAFREAYLAVASGEHDIVLASGLEKMTDVDGAAATYALSTAADQEYECYQGITFPGLYALMARVHMQRHSTTREQLAAVAVKNHRHGALNPLAQFQSPVTIKQVMESMLVADPLRLLDCSPISDGAAATVVTSVRPSPVDGTVVEVLACEQASGPASIHYVEDLTSFPATVGAAARAYARAGIDVGEVDVVELHDCFSIAEIVDCEDLGLLPRGEAAAAIAEGATTHGTGSVVVKPSGGLLSRGHPVGATGLAQVHELVAQLRGTSSLQVEGARLGLAHNLGGCGATATVTILGAA